MRRFTYALLPFVLFCVSGTPVHSQAVDTSTKTPQNPSTSALTDKAAFPVDSAASPVENSKPSAAAETATNELVRDVVRWDRYLNTWGIDPHFSIKTEASAIFAGAAHSQRMDARNLFELSANVDLEKAVHWRGASVYASMHNFVGGNGSDDLSDDIQVYSNISAAQKTQLFEFWFQQNLLSGKLRFKAGKIDANTEFAFADNAGGFLNSSMGFSPTVSDFSTYPSPRLGAAVFLKPQKFLYLSTSVFRNDPSGVMSVSEAGLRWNLYASELPGHVAYGYWLHTQTYLDQNQYVHSGAAGHYVVAEQALWRPHSSAEGGRNIGTFFQYGNADPWSSDIDRHFGAGLQWTGPLSQRPGDQAGVGISFVHLHPDDSGNSLGDHERVADAFYKFQVKRWLALTADMQFIDHPNGDPARPRALVGSLRSTVSF